MLLLHSWVEYIIPQNREAVWTIVPVLGSTFMHEFGMSRDAGIRLPNRFPADDGPVNRNIPHTEQEYSKPLYIHRMIFF